uniref:DH domain-containing protein n=1 Tax=Meloidogyne javanica TaxID=6303 RepID=A0A915M8X9_MELJA
MFLLNSGFFVIYLTENNITEATTEETTNTAPSPPQMTPEESSRLKRSYVLQELVETERAYVVDLASIVDGYIGTLKEMELSDEDREKVKIIFANIEQILDFHKSVFCKEIEKSLQDYEAAGNAFIKYERRLHTFYVKYCQNKPKSDFLVSQDNFEQLLFDVKDRLGHKVSINDLLIKPVQRITKYQLMLSDILKYTHRANDRAEVLERAHDVMRVVPKACDDMMQVGRLQGFQGNLTAQGRLIFQVNKMVLEENVVDEPLRFVLQSNDPNQPATFVAQSATSEDKEQWLIKLSTQLDQQKTFLAALVDPKRYLANSMGSMNISGKKDSSGSLGTPTSPGITPGNITIPTSGSGSTTSSGAISPTKPRATQQKSSGSKLFGFVFSVSPTLHSLALHLHQIIGIMLLLLVIVGLCSLVALIIVCSIITTKKDPEGKSKADVSHKDVEAGDGNSVIGTKIDGKPTDFDRTDNEVFSEDLDLEDISRKDVEAGDGNSVIGTKIDGKPTDFDRTDNEVFSGDLDLEDVEAGDGNSVIGTKINGKPTDFDRTDNEVFSGDLDLEDISHKDVEAGDGNSVIGTKINGKPTITEESNNVKDEVDKPEDGICSFAADGKLIFGGQMTIECKASVNASIKTAGLSDDERMQLSVHESGHAWVAFRSGLRVVKITLIPNGELLGRTIIEHGAKHIWSLKEKDDLQIALWGARQAEVTIRGSGMTTLFGSDKMAIEKLASSNVREYGLLEDQSLATMNPESNEFLALKDRAIYKNMRFCELEAKKIVEEDKEIINALADTLLRFNELDNEEEIKSTLTDLHNKFKKK